ncbi:MAG: hypothetical protein DCF19_08465 [Pseudanabaena frigida]|uniref:Uncharacterized protein n=1 Tax=Pseudanabaena frigida TaxID=945775 RepID=A0A2W4WBQ4_9CYAN|nr:MAG: hypothetical protein DCF19_08465 [Pseudanabaena frigida]
MKLKTSWLGFAHQNSFEFLISQVIESEILIIFRFRASFMDKLKTVNTILRLSIPMAEWQH